MLTYPKMFTDPEWKKLEKSIKVSATGVGQALRDLEKAHVRLDAGCQAMAKGTAKAASVKPALTATVTAAKKAYDTISKTYGNSKNTPAADKALGDYRHKFGRYIAELDSFDLASHHGIERPVERFNDRLKMLR